MRVAPPVTLDRELERTLKKVAKSNTTSVRFARRAQIVLLAAEGYDNLHIAEKLGVGRIQVSRWRDRFLEYGIAGIRQDLPRGGRKPFVDAQELVRLTTQTTPENATHWSTRTLARRAGVSATTVRRVWHAHGLKPHLVKTFKVSRDPLFAEKLGGHRGSVSESARACARAVLRREEPSTSARPLATRFAAKEGPRRDDDP